jgi:hypothetical protein
MVGKQEEVPGPRAEENQGETVANQDNKDVGGDDKKEEKDQAADVEVDMAMSNGTPADMASASPPVFEQIFRNAR